MRPPFLSLSLLLLHLVALPLSTSFNPLSAIARDFRALTQKHTSYHILRPSTPAGRSKLVDVKELLRRNVMEGGWVVDEFEDLARRYSACKDTAARGGLLGEKLPQGAIRDGKLDRACFEVPLGECYGPVESDEGWNLVLVVERYGCRKDGGMTRLVKEGGSERIWGGALEGGGDGVNSVTDAVTLTVISMGGIVVAGGILAELAANLAENIT